MTLGLTPRQGDVLTTTAGFCEGRVGADSIYGVLHRECFSLFPDEMFADVFTDVGRRSVPPMIVAVVMVLQRVEGCSDREAVERFAFDARWKYAAGGLPFDYPGFVHTVLVDMRARLAASARPDRIFEVTLAAARAAGLVGRKRVLDSTPLYDAVATMDTVTLLRSGIRGVLRAAAAVDPVMHGRLVGVLARDDDYAAAGKPVCDYEDRDARERLVDELARDAHAVLAVLDGRELPAPIAEAGTLLAALAGQDLDCVDGVFRIVRRVAPDRVISTVDPAARHGHKTSARGFDGYKGHVAVDPDSEIITATAVTPGNDGDAAAAPGLLAGELPRPAPGDGPGEPGDDDHGHDDAGGDQHDDHGNGHAGHDASGHGRQPLAVYGDAAYGAGALVADLEAAGAAVMVKVPPPSGRAGMFAKDRFIIDIANGQVTCPAGTVAPLKPARDGGAAAAFGASCLGCPLAAQCTTSPTGRSIRTTRYEAELVRARTAQADPQWRAEYRATRPKVERKIGHLMRRKHGGRSARVRGTSKIAADFSLLAAGVNLARLARLGITSTAMPGWSVAAA